MYFEIKNIKELKAKCAFNSFLFVEIPSLIGVKLFELGTNRFKISSLLKMSSFVIQINEL